MDGMQAEINERRLSEITQITSKCIGGFIGPRNAIHLIDEVLRRKYLTAETGELHVDGESVSMSNLIVSIRGERSQSECFEYVRGSGYGRNHIRLGREYSGGVYVLYQHTPV
ncbi:hypothetical protein [Paenibacillus sp. PDC88]|uniref:hypothetical protein n=1 Tax=Paenibacillus sp. PDC88 TaxID=1884375 RepID=UPI00089A14B6|nr:hypothetical protein [Paenibacillus sp. PDC88]SDW24554.1 hypothetical protein SAMN05518848_101774 [Paenibacillus sp. PDC88]